MSSQDTTGGLTKWQLALLVGVPVAAVCVGAAVYYWKPSPHSAAEDEVMKEEKVAFSSEEREEAAARDSQNQVGGVPVL